jgi:hypothetical protein
MDGWRVISGHGVHIMYSSDYAHMIKCQIIKKTMLKWQLQHRNNPVLVTCNNLKKEGWPVDFYGCNSDVKEDSSSGNAFKQSNIPVILSLTAYAVPQSLN